VSAPPVLARALVGALVVLAVDAALLAFGLGGLSVLAREPRALALLAIWGAGGLVLALKRPVRGQNTTQTRPDPLPMAVLLVVPLVTPLVGAYAARRAWATLPYANTVSWAGVAIVAAGLWLRIGSMVQLGPRFSPLVAVQDGHVLETSGAYAWVRHPGYLGALLACLGGAIAFGSGAALPLVALMLAAQLARVRREETLLAEHFGDAWKAYAARTGALLPFVGRGR
jgi:protein-S-isoprenylcysteine O-methyltransferase Ste14